ncbi:MAG TPA: TraB/GumN family protein [Xanthomonadales bacterium]|nr:TraB/GumN family protein [Xanthomonadales bacterium]
MSDPQAPEPEAETAPESSVISEQPIRQVQRDGVNYTLLGTAHVSRASAEAVEEMASSGDYDVVAVELCQTRFDALRGERDWKDLDLYKIIRQGKAGLVMANLALSAYQRRIAEQFGIEPGAEMRAAARIAAEKDIPLQLVDRDLAVTLRRSYASVPWYKRFYMMTGLLLGVVSSDEIDEESIEKLKEGDILESTFTEFAQHSPALYEALITERDRYMAAGLREQNADRKEGNVLVVVGAGHLDGLAKHLEGSHEEPEQLRNELSVIPPRAKWPKLIPWLIMILVLVGFYLGFSKSPELGWKLVYFWVAINGGLAALGALIARAHPLTILSAVVAAPLTSLNPTIAAGMVTGLVESYLRKPKVSDLENLRDDVTSLKGWFKNPATRILLVFFLSNVGSSIGTYVAGFKIFGALS